MKMVLLRLSRLGKGRLIMLAVVGVGLLAVAFSGLVVGWLSPLEKDRSFMNIPSAVTLKVGESYALRLKGSGATGYAWEYTIEGSSAVFTITHTTVGVPPQATPGGVPPTNYSLDDLFTLQAHMPGQARMHLILRRPWETTLPPLEEHTIDVSVTDT